MQDTAQLRLKEARKAISTFRQKILTLPSLDTDAYKDVIAEIAELDKPEVFGVLENLSAFKATFLGALDDGSSPEQHFSNDDDDTAYNEKAATIYDLLRQSWEAFIERDLLNQAIQRHDTDVQTLRLREVEVLDTDCVAIHEGMAKCSTWIAGHDKSTALDVNRPSPTEIRRDITDLRLFAKKVVQRREAVRTRRKGLMEPQIPQIG